MKSQFVVVDEIVNESGLLAFVVCHVKLFFSISHIDQKTKSLFSARIIKWLHSAPFVYF